MFQQRLTRRAFLRTSAMAGVGLAAVACVPAAGPASGGAAEAGSAPAADVVTVRFMSRAGADNNVQAQKTLDEDFRAENAGIQVQVEAAPDGWEEKLLAQMVAGEAVDIFEAWGNIFFNWTERDLLLDVQSFVDRDLTDEQISDYNDFQWTGLVMRGKRVGMPKYINIMTVCVNVDAFEKYGVDLPPEDGNWTHDDYLNTAKQLTEAARKEGNDAFWGGWKPMWNWDRFWNTIYMFGGQVVDEKYGKKCMLDTPESQQALQWVYDIMWKDNFWAQPSQVENKWGHENISNNFIGYAEDGTYPIGMAKRFEGVVKWDLRHVPTGPTGKRSVLGTTDAWSITKQTKNPEEAWKVLSFLSGPVYQDKQIVGVEGIIPVLKSRIATFIDTVREIRPDLADVRLETIQEVLDWGYAEDSFWFDKQNAANQIIVPALEKVFMVGDVGPEYFIEITQQVDASQQA
ncbi:MAG: extracellular solute-binding protein [Caldilinea sp. CFX5]|nr:extracellular solute-binding protein [Caldilinea sp. CFX5]